MMDESIFSKEPIYQYESRGSGLTRMEVAPTEPGMFGMGTYEFWADSSTVTLEIPLAKCLLDPRKQYALRISVFEV